MKKFLHNLKIKLHGLWKSFLSYPPSRNIYNIGWLIGAVIISYDVYFDEKLRFSSIAIFFFASVFSIGFASQLLEEAKAPKSVMGEIAVFYKKLKSTVIYKLLLYVFTSLLAALAYTAAQKSVSMTMSMPPTLFFNSVAIMTPLIWVFITLIVILSGIGLTMTGMLFWLLLSCFADLREMFRPFYNMTLGLYLTLRNDHEQAVDVLSEPLGSKSNFPSISPFVGVVCAFSIVYYFCNILGDILFSNEYLELRKEGIVLADYFEWHHCNNVLEDGSFINYINDKTVSVANKLGDAWKIETKPCLLF